MAKLGHFQVTGCDQLTKASATQMIGDVTPGNASHFGGRPQLAVTGLVSTVDLLVPWVMVTCFALSMRWALGVSRHVPFITFVLEACRKKEGPDVQHNFSPNLIYS